MRPERVFQSIHHPRGMSRVMLYAQWLVRPLAVCMLPIMILTLVEVLQGGDVLPYLYVGFPAAIILASLWTGFRMRSAPAEIVVSGPFAEVRTVLEVLSGTASRPWRIVLEVRKSADHIQLALGESVYDFAVSEWPDSGALLRGLQGARSAPYEVETDAGASQMPSAGEA